MKWWEKIWGPGEESEEEAQDREDSRIDIAIREVEPSGAENITRFSDVLGHGGDGLIMKSLATGVRRNGRYLTALHLHTQPRSASEPLVHTLAQEEPRCDHDHQPVNDTTLLCVHCGDMRRQFVSDWADVDKYAVFEGYEFCAVCGLCVLKGTGCECSSHVEDGDDA